MGDIFVKIEIFMKLKSIHLLAAFRAVFWFWEYCLKLGSQFAHYFFHKYRQTELKVWKNMEKGILFSVGSVAKENQIC